MTESSFKTSSSKYQEPKNNQIICSSKVNSKFELKSNIPKPIPYIRNKGPSANTYVTQTQSACRIPRAVQPTRRGRTSLSLQPRPSSAYKKDNVGLPKPKTVSGAAVKKNPYPDVRAKVNTKPKTKLQSQVSLTSVHRTKSNTSSQASSKKHFYMEPVPEQPEEEKKANNERLIEQKRQLLATFNELKKKKPIKEVQPMEEEICRFVRREAFGCAGESLSYPCLTLLSEGAPEFLTAFETKTQELVGLWLKFICDLISTEQSVGSSILSRLSLPDPSLNLREEVHRFLSNLSSGGEPLHKKLQRIEEEQFMAMTKVMLSVVAQTKELNDLQDKYNRLEKTQDEIHYKMNEEIAILGNENRELDRKYVSAVEKYNLEKSKAEQQERHKLLINKETIEVKKMIKVMEGKCAEYEAKVRKAEVSVRNLETAMRNKDVASELEGKQHRELVNKFNELKETIRKQKSEMAENNEIQTSLETEKTDMQSELTSLKALLDENVRIRNELVEELSSKTKKLNEVEAHLDLMKAHAQNIQGNKDSKAAVEDSALKRSSVDCTEIRWKEIEIEELRRKISSMEHAMKEKSIIEDNLRRQVAEMNKQPHEVEVTLKAQIKDLQYSVKDLTEERAELEKIIAQKTLELDQRDLLLQQHSQVLRSRDDLIPMIQSRKRYDHECLERLRGFVFEQEKTYFDKGLDGGFSRDDQCMYDSIRAPEKLYSFDPKKVDMEMSFRQEKMTELYSLLEHKQMEMMQLERRVRKLLGAQVQRERTVKEQAACISSLEKALGGQNTNKSRGLFSLLSGQDSPNC